MNKIVCVDVDGTLISKDKNPRPYFHLVLDFCVTYGAELVVWSLNGEAYVEKIVGELFPQIIGKAKFHGKEDHVLFTPTYVIDDDESMVRKYGGFCVPYYQPNLHNQFQCIMLTGRVIEGILNHIRGKKPQNKLIEPNKEQSEDDRPDGDPGAIWGMNV